jgi:hypothetical protein
VELLFGCVVMTGIAVLAGLVFGVRALALTRTHSEASSLKLIALNLLEPGVTMLVLFVGSIISDLMGLKGGAIFVVPAIALIPLTWMLLAPLWTRISHSLRGALITYGLLRWLNTIAFWYFCVQILNASSSNGLATLITKLLSSGTLAAYLTFSGTLILCVSVTHLAVGLSNFRVKPGVTPTSS